MKNVCFIFTLKTEGNFLPTQYRFWPLLSVKWWEWKTYILFFKKKIEVEHSSAITNRIPLLCSSLYSLCNYVTNPVWLRLRSSINRNWRKQKHKRKIHCLQKKLLNRRSKQGSHDEVTIPKQPECNAHSTCNALFYFVLLFNFVRCKEVGSALNDCATLFRIKKYVGHFSVSLICLFD